MSWKSFSRTRLPRPPAKPCPRERSPRLPSAAARGRFPQCPDPRLREPRVPRAPFCAARGARPFPCAARGAPALSVSCSIWAARGLQIQKEPDPRGTGLVTPSQPRLRDGTDVRGLKPLRSLLHLELDLLPLGQGAEAVRLDGGVMAEDVRASIVLHDEPEPLRIIEPFHCASHHYPLLSMLRAAPCRPARMTSGCANVTPGVPNLIPKRLPLPGNRPCGCRYRRIPEQKSRSPASFLPSTTYLSWCAKNGLRSQRAGERCPPPPDLPARPPWFRRP